ncbi:hypothetical protein N7535_009356 [Penicillium sp. DV-2018c]|nr:hypothetical protein N7535_009356 [Penicillium sp. DV-2018c]
MSQTISDKPHLYEDDLPESADAERKILAAWASSATFKKQADDFEIHDSDELERKLSPFLEKLGLVVKERSTSCPFKSETHA